MNRFLIPASAKSWVPVPADSPFPIQNLPFGVCLLDEEGSTTVAVPIGEQVLILLPLQEEGLIGEELELLENLDAISPQELSELRREIFDLLREGNPKLRDNKELRSDCLYPLSEAFPATPMHIGAFVDFYSGIHHASNVGKMFRPDMPPLLPNYRWMPIGYNGRSSSIVPDGSDIERPRGQIKVGDDDPIYVPTRELDFELEVGFFVGGETEAGETVPVADAESYMMGLVLVNDWSARDVQRFEYQPLGPFLAKSFATSISPWIVTLDALAPFRCEGMAQEPAPLPHLASVGRAHYDIELEVSIQSAKMTQPQVICRSNTKHLYWSFAQQLAHQTSNGTPLETGDLYGSGTISGADKGMFGSMLELCWRGTEPITLTETGETRTFLEDGDTVIMSGWAQGNGFRVGLGEVRSTVIPARPWSG